MAKNKRPPALSGPRNPLHRHPLMQKGGIHQKTTKAKRQQDKVNLKKEWPVVSAAAFTTGHFFASGQQVGRQAATHL